MPVNATEKSLLDAVDGKCCIGEILDRTISYSGNKVQLDMALAFFERLWWYDQLVFDTSAK
jgi:hypothetical protein